MLQDIHDGPSERDTDTTSRKRPSQTGEPAAKKADRAKRVRVSRACDQCRAGREKCDGAQPTCQTCEIQNRSCTYHEQPKKRGIQPNYIRTLELTLAWLLQTYPGCEVKLSQLLPNPNEEVHQLIAFKEANASDALHAVWRNGIVCRQIDQLLSGATIEIPQQTDDDSGAAQLNDSAYGGNGTDFGEVNVPYHSPPQSAPSDGHAALLDVQGSGLPFSPPQGSFSQPQSSVARLQLPTKAWSMLEDYFTFTQTWLPITEKHDILKLMYSYPAPGLPRNEAVSSDHAELWSIMTWAAARMEGEARMEASRCRDIARSLIPKEANITLGHVKTLLILGLVDLLNATLLPAWLTIGSAVRLMAHLTSQENTGSSLIGDRVKHTYLAAFVLESTIASQTGALAHLKPEDITSVGPVEEDGLDEWSPWQDPANESGSQKSPARSISTFNELVRMALRRPPSLTATPQSPHPPQELSVVFDLLRNGSANNSRQHPSALLANRRQSDQNTDLNNLPTVGATSITHARTHSSPMDFWNVQPSGSQGLQGMSLETQYPFMSIPNETTESLPGSTPAQMTVSTATPSLWLGESSHARMPEPHQHSQAGPTSQAGAGGDIFEELAMLDRTDSTQKPNFMENLGFGPDLDLAEFFGADYQPSDPLLAYMQPNEFADFSQAYEAEKDAG
ncbi:hypothetical protein M409DRAFT_24115 [Zasmidium cellare ATCC 36951]|uniref:Zn(2)-C6 fungal-type domain-containing protein n=1 Tax=Zasmidium cellare ATCC 36951 TaxID=1080233 RepID=A0A6A6CI14_ZASCE|nr:uncharacterized protein M409DRAFT_24115 [Zasmidium cellare ATCC 36951]KAF2165828.1 hypothetical protein M409DRAFT_24115 [Zasmidium cellare ATCC 36951]